MDDGVKSNIVRKVQAKGAQKIASLSNSVRRKAWLLSAEGKMNQQRLDSLKNKYTGKRCFIMANGPSLLKSDLSLLKTEITISSNAQFLIWDKMGFIPTFLTVEDTLVGEDRSKELNAIDTTTKIFPQDLDYCLKWDSSTMYINFIRQYKGFPTFSPDFGKKVYWGGTVSFLNMQLAYYLGCSEIYLIGFDHNYTVTQKIVDTVITSEKDDVNHIHPDYFGKGYRWHDPNVERMERSYLEARGFLDERNIKIRNATVGGKLEIFERVDYNKLF